MRRHQKGGVQGRKTLVGRRPAETATAVGGLAGVLSIIYGIFPHLTPDAQKAITALITAVVALIPAITSTIHDYLTQQSQIAADLEVIKKCLKCEEGLPEGAATSGATPLEEEGGEIHVEVQHNG